MTMSGELLDEVEAELNIIIDDSVRKYLQQEYNIEPFPVVWTENYLVQEIHRAVELYEEGEWEPVQRSAYERLLAYYEGLKRDYLDLVYDMQVLTGEVKDPGENK